MAGRPLTYTYPIEDNFQELIIRGQLLEEFKVSATGQVDKDGEGILRDELEQQDLVSTYIPRS